jgi:HAD superfamily hydrolase (TIGR01509 family)
MKKYYKTLNLFLFIMLTSILSSAISTSFNTQIEAVIFDCDGVLVDTEHLKFLAWQEALATDGIDFSIEDYMPLIGHSSKNILRMIKEQKGVDIPLEIIEVKNAKYHALQKQGVPPIKEMVAFAKQLAQDRQQLRIKFGLASSASTKEILENLTQIGLENTFDLIISGSNDLEDYVDVEGKNKPKPYIYIEAAKRLNLSPSNCLVLEDTAAGIEAATTAGMIAIAVPNQFTIKQDFSKASAIIHSVSELTRLLNFSKKKENGH